MSPGLACPSFQNADEGTVYGFIKPPILGPSFTSIIGVCPARLIAPAGYPWSIMFDGSDPFSRLLFVALSVKDNLGPSNLYPVRSLFA